MNRLYIAIAFGAGMLFMNSLTGEHSRYGMDVMRMIERCERNQQKECDIIAAPVSKVSFISEKSLSLS